MLFIDRQQEIARLDALMVSDQGGLVVVYGRRRIGKTRLLLEWSRRRDGLYTVADQSAAEVQRRYFAEAVAARLPGFADVDYRDWRGLLARLAREAQLAGWRGPIVFDELPYLVLASPELPSVLQRWVDHEAREARLVVAIAGSSQRMMQGFVLSGDAPLFGRAREVLRLGPIAPTYIAEAFSTTRALDVVELYAAWGGVPRYWELACELGGGVRAQLEPLVLDPLGALHREPDRLLLEEVPSALEARPLLDAIGAGAHRVSEIAGRLGRPATSMSRPLERLLEMELVRREVPFGESAKKSRRALYKIDDPFVRLWFRIVAPYRGQLSSTPAIRQRLLDRFWPELVAQTWEELCRQQLPWVEPATAVGQLGPWGPAGRWWQAELPEWDVISESLDGERLLLGEAKWSAQPYDQARLERAARELARRPVPRLAKSFARLQPRRALFVPRTVDGVEPPVGVDLVVTAEDLLSLT